MFRPAVTLFSVTANAVIEQVRSRIWVPKRREKEWAWELFHSGNKHLYLISLIRQNEDDKIGGEYGTCGRYGKDGKD